MDTQETPSPRKDLRVKNIRLLFYGFLAGFVAGIMFIAFVLSDALQVNFAYDLTQTLVLATILCTFILAWGIRNAMKQD